MKNFQEKFNSFGHEIEVKSTDSGKKNWMLLLHGFNDSKETFIFLEESLGSKFNLLSFDFRGHGNSDWSRDGIYHYAEHFLDIHNIAKQFLPEKFFILAHSMGASLASRYTGMYPDSVKGLVCLEGFSGLQPPEREIDRIKGWLNSQVAKGQKTTAPRRPMKREDALQKLSLIYSGLAKEKVEILLEPLVRKTVENKYVWKNDPSLRTSSNPIPFSPILSRALWSKIVCPVLILYGKKSHLWPENLEEVLGHFKNREFHILENSGHNMHHDEPEKTAEYIFEFLYKNSLLD